jgi:uncharacterized protein
MVAAERQPVFFGPGPLYGCHHRSSAASSTLGAVLCPPFGADYLSAHRTVLQLAVRLAARGYGALRFDYYGCGDSAGASGEGGLERWTRDVQAAADEVRSATGATRLCLIGFGLGGALAARAARAAAATGGAAALVLWDPVVQGPAYLAELRRRQCELLQRADLDPLKIGIRNVAEHEAVGFPLPAILRDELAGLDLLRLDRPPAARVLLVQGDTAQDCEPLRARLDALGCVVERVCVSERAVWHDARISALVPNSTIDLIVEWIGRSAA